MDKDKLIKYIDSEFDTTVLPTFLDYLRIQNQTPCVDKDWNKNGYLNDAVNLVANWIVGMNIQGLDLHIIKDDDKTPLILVEIEKFNTESNKTHMIYGHVDKQPPNVGWVKNYGPYEPVIDDGKIYARGCSDDGYAPFAAFLAIKAVQLQNLSHPRIILLIEASEESGSVDMPYYLTKLAPKIGNPNFIICLDSVGADYERLWVSDTLRGVINLDITVRCLNKGVHNGIFGGVVPDSFMVMRNLISRFEDTNTGEIPALQVEISEKVIESTKKTAEVLGDAFFKQVPTEDGVIPLKSNVIDLLLNNAWKPSMTLCGSSGIPEMQIAGNVLRPETTFRLNFRIPPTLEPKTGLANILEILTKNVPFNSSVKVENIIHAEGFVINTFSEKVLSIISEVSKLYYGNDHASIGFGGTIPIMNMLKAIYPSAQYFISGICNMDSFAHGPNENLDITSTKKFICCLAHIISKHSLI